MKKVLLFCIMLIISAGLAFAGGQQGQSQSSGGAVKLIWYFPPPGGFIPTDNAILDKIHAKMINEVGVDLEYIIAPFDGTEMLNKLNLMLAAGDQVDFFTQNWEPFQAAGVLADLTAEVNKSPNLLSVFGDDLGAMKTTDGKIWGIPRGASMVTAPVYIRQDWLTQAGLQVPKTLDDLDRVLETFARLDPAGNGRTIPLLVEGIPTGTLQGAFSENGDGVYVAPNGKVYPNFMDPGYRDMLVKLNEWYVKGWIDKESFIYNPNQIIDLIRANRAGVTMMWYSRVTLNEAELQKSVPTANYINVPLSGPKGFFQTQNSLTRYRFGATGGTNSYVVNRNCRDIAAVIRLLDWGFTPENYVTTRYGLEGDAWRWVDKPKGVFEFIGTPPPFGDELAISKGLPEFWVRERVSANEKHTSYLTDGTITNFTYVKIPTDAGLHFDTTPLLNAAPNMADMGRMVTEESIKFITGARPFSEYDRFLADLNQLGMERLSDEITRQYRAFGK